jgi:hypothetical protein
MTLLKRFTLSPRYLSFWPLQMAGWGVYLSLNVLSSIPYRHRPDYLAFRGAFLASSFLASFPMYWLCHTLWKRRPGLSTVAAFCIVTSYPLGLLCAAAAFQSGIVFSTRRPPFTWSDVITAAPSGWFALIAWSSFYFGIKYYLELEEKHRQLLAIERLAREAEIRALRYQLQPHFLFNTLNAISTLVLGEQIQPATEMIGKLAHMLRSTLDSPDLHRLPLSDELAVTEEYLDIERVRFGDRLVVRWDIDPGVRNVLVPRLLLQPLVENAVRHGVARRPRGGFIHITARRAGSSLAVHIENELPEEASSILLDRIVRPGGVGLENTRLRLKEMYGEAGSMHASPNARGNYEVSLLLPGLDAATTESSTGHLEVYEV